MQPSNGAVLSADGIHSRSDADVMASSASAPYCRPRAAELCLEHRHALMQRVALLSQLLRSCFGRNLYAGAAAQRKASDQSDGMVLIKNDHAECNCPSLAGQEGQCSMLTLVNWLQASSIAAKEPTRVEAQRLQSRASRSLVQKVVEMYSKPAPYCRGID